MAVNKIKRGGNKTRGVDHRIEELDRERKKLTEEAEGHGHCDDELEESQLQVPEKADAIKRLDSEIDRLLRLKEVLEIVPVSASTWWSWVATSFAPAPIKLGRCTCWMQSEIADFIQKGRIA